MGLLPMNLHRIRSLLTPTLSSTHFVEERGME
jgi:hypothetical protein